MKKRIVTTTIATLILLSTAFLYALETPPTLQWEQKSEFSANIVLQKLIFKIDTSLNRILNLKFALSENDLHSSWYLSTINSETGELVDDKRIDFPCWLGVSECNIGNNTLYHQNNDTLYFPTMYQSINLTGYGHLPYFSSVKLRLSEDGLEPLPAYSDGYMVDTSNNWFLLLFTYNPLYHHIKNTNEWILEITDSNKQTYTFGRPNAEGVTTATEVKLDTIVTLGIPNIDADIYNPGPPRTHSTFNIDDTLTLKIIEMIKKTDYNPGFNKEQLTSGQMFAYYNRATGEVYSTKFIPETKNYTVSNGISYTNDKIYSLTVSVPTNLTGRYKSNTINEINLDGEILRTYISDPYSISPIINQYQNDNNYVINTAHYFPADSNYLYVYGNIDLKKPSQPDYSKSYKYKSFISKYKIINNDVCELLWEFEYQYKDNMHTEINNFFVYNNNIYVYGKIWDENDLTEEGWPRNNNIWAKFSEPVGISEPTIYTNILLSPNPANSTATLSLDLEKAGDLQITLTNIIGQEVLQIHNSFVDVGPFTHTFSVVDLPSGTYFIHIQLGNNTKYEKLIIK